MFFILGIDHRQTPLDFDQTVICPRCGRFGHVRIYRSCWQLSLFFLPVLRWGRQYMAVLECCGASSSLDNALGRELERGHITELDLSQLHWDGQQARRCRSCGYETTEDFTFCPRCGTRF